MYRHVVCIYIYKYIVVVVVYTQHERIQKKNNQNKRTNKPTNIDIIGEEATIIENKNEQNHVKINNINHYIAKIIRLI